MALNFQGIKSLVTRPNFGLLIIRLAVAAILLHAGVGKFSGGDSVLHAVGANVSSIGINIGSNNALTLMLGILAAGSQAVGSVLLALGFFARTGAFFMLITMTVATVSMFQSSGGDFTEFAYPMLVALCLLGLIFTGPGRIALQRD